MMFIRLIMSIRIKMFDLETRINFKEDIDNSKFLTPSPITVKQR